MTFRDWLSRNWSAVAGLLAAAIGVLDLETTGRAGAEWDRALIVAGLSLTAGHTLPVAQAALEARFRRPKVDVD